MTLRGCIFRRTTPAVVACCGGMALFGTTGLAAADTTTTPGPPCGTAFNPYAFTAAQDESCGIATSTSAVVTPLAGGGSKTEYTMPDGQGVTTLYSPPAGFDPVTATPAQLTEYGFPTPPASGGIETLEDWQAEVSQLTESTSNPPFLAEGNASADAAGSGTSSDWSGYKAQPAGGGISFSSASWVEPTYQPSACDNNSAVIWTGIGGWMTDPDLGQDGSAHGEGNDNPGGANHQMWEEALPQQKTLQPLPVTGSAGDEMYTNVSWDSGSYTGTVGDITTNKYKNWSHAGSFSGISGEAIVERPKYSNGLRSLSNFATMHFTNASENSKTLNNYPNPTALTMLDAGGTTMATPAGLGSNGSFTDTQHSCK